MDYPVIAKPKLEEINVRPNLDEYDSLVQNFSWEQLRRELDGLPGGGLNLAHEAIDRHAMGRRADRVAMYWEGTGGEEETYTFAQMKELTDKFANVLRGLGVEKGDRVFIFMGRIPELYVAFFGILKSGAIAGPLFSAFGPDPVKDRLLDSGAKVLIVTPDLRNRVSDILKDLPDLKHVMVVNKNNRSQEPLAAEDTSYEKEMASASSDFQIVPTTEEDFSIMHYTSGTTGKPKGAAHAHLAA
ncbi:MAG: AMP-binding protein, partial [Dehalococcoidia bacterium]|nr:AMP-binding protein [Dehalococcoidia bacterium]